MFKLGCSNYEISVSINIQNQLVFETIFYLKEFCFLEDWWSKFSMNISHTHKEEIEIYVLPSFFPLKFSKECHLNGTLEVVLYPSFIFYVVLKFSAD